MKLNIIIEKRNDAIGIYNKNLISNLLQINDNFTVTEVNNIRFKNNLLNYFSEIINFILLYFKISKNEILLFTDPKPLSSNIAHFLSNKKIVIVHHLDKDPTYYKIFRFLNMKKLLLKFDKIITISNFSKNQVEDLGIKPEKINVIYNGIDHDLFKQSNNSSPIKDKYVLSVGSEDPRKNMVNILKSFALLKNDFKDLKLIKVGKVKTINRKKTLEIIKKLKIEKDVIFTDFIDENKLADYYSNAELLLFPSLLEGFGFPIVEAMACGCPVITSNRNPMKELAGETQILVDPQNFQEIAQKCKKVLIDNELKNTMSTEGKRRSQMFDWKLTTKKIQETILK